MIPLPDGLIAVVKSECRTCAMIQPILTRLDAARTPLTVFTQGRCDVSLRRIQRG